MAKEFLPFLMEKKTQTALIWWEPANTKALEYEYGPNWQVASTSSGLAMVPITRCPNYCASKAALHHWLLVLREQLKETNVKVIEIFPPAVQSKNQILITISPLLLHVNGVLFLPIQPNSTTQSTSPISSTAESSASRWRNSRTRCVHPHTF